MINPLLAPVAAIDGNGVDGGGNPYPRPLGRHGFGKSEIGVMGEDAAVDMAARHIDQPVGPLHDRQPAYDIQGHRRHRPLRPVEHGLVTGCQPQFGQVGIRKRHVAVVDGEPVIIDHGTRGGGQLPEQTGRQAQHRDRPAEHPAGDQRAKCQDFLCLAKDQRGRCQPVQRQLQKHAASAA